MQPAPPIPGKRPKTLTAAAIIALIWGVICSFPLVTGILAFAGIQFQGADPASVAIANDPTMQAMTKWGGVINGSLGVLLVAAGIGLFKCREWARVTTILWSIFSVISGVVVTYFTAVTLGPLLEGAVRTEMARAGNSSPAEMEMAMSIAKGAIMVGLIFGFLLTLAIAITLIVLVTRQRAKAACKGGIA